MAILPLTKGYFTIIDDEDVERVCRWKWHASINKKRVMARKGAESVYLSRFIMKCPAGMEVDHINGDTLDNRKCNLRVCTKAENIRNRKMMPSNTTGYKGVTVVKNRGGKYRAAVRFEGRTFYAGSDHATAELAARAYDQLAIRLHGKFALLNFQRVQ